MESSFDVMSLAGPTDYRLGRVKAWESFVTPLGPKADAHVQRIWERLTDVPEGEPVEIRVLGTQPACAGKRPWLRPVYLCRSLREPRWVHPTIWRSPRHFQTLFVESIPALKTSQRNEAKRFVLLIDTLYDARSASRGLLGRSRRSGIYPQGDHRFEFARTVSRLQEMQSAAWWGQKIVET